MLAFQASLLQRTPLLQAHKQNRARWSLRLCNVHAKHVKHAKHAGYGMAFTGLLSVLSDLVLLDSTPAAAPSCQTTPG